MCGRSAFKLYFLPLKTLKRQQVEQMPRNMLKYSEDEIFWTLRDRAQSIFDKLSDKDKNLLCYLMNPRCTAIGAAFSYNEQTISDFLYNRCTDIAEHTPINGNSDYTLNCVIDGIKAGKY